MKKLAEKHRDKVIDLLTERLVFERGSVRLYDQILAKMRAAGPDGEALAPQLDRYRNQEKEHEEWLESQIRALGGDAHGSTDRSRLVERETKSVEEVVAADAEITHLLHALLTAELADNAGWDLLAELADEAGDEDARDEFEERLRAEEEHLAFAREALQNLSILEVLGSPEASV